jgi:DNA-binding NarL/FixJ family response regulator
MVADGLIQTTKYIEQPAVLFIGDSVNFSSMYLRLTQSEFPDIAIKKVATLNDARTFISSHAAQIRAVILSCQLDREAVLDLQSLVDEMPSLRPVLAYQTLDELRSALTAIEGRAFFERLSFLPLRVRMDCTVTTLRLILSGERYVTGEVLDIFMASTAPENVDLSGFSTLTAREKEVLEQLAKGASNKIIAHDLDLAESTVKLHIHHIISKLNVSNRTEAAVAYIADLAKKQAASS